MIEKKANWKMPDIVLTQDEKQLIVFLRENSTAVSCEPVIRQDRLRVLQTSLVFQEFVSLLKKVIVN